LQHCILTYFHVLFCHKSSVAYLGLIYIYLSLTVLHIAKNGFPLQDVYNNYEMFSVCYFLVILHSY